MQKKNAVVKIINLYQGVPVSSGAGFFISESGKIVTNRHVIRRAVIPGYSLKIENADGEITYDISIFDCGGKKGIDLCILKVNQKPKAWFTLKNTQPIIGKKVYVIGHPYQLDYSLSDGLISGLRVQKKIDAISKTEVSVKQIQVTSPISTGNSGGPIMDEDGNLLGVATYILEGQGLQNLNFGLLADEVVEMDLQSKTAVPISAFFNGKNSEVKKAFQKFTAEDFPKNFSVLAHPKTWPKTLIPLYVDFEKTFKIKFPASSGFFIDGAPACNAIQTFFTNCFDSKDFGYLQIKYIKKDGDLMKKNGLTFPPEPLQMTADLIKSGNWETAKKTLTPQQIKFLYSKSSPIKCEKLARAEGSLPPKTEICSEFIYNALEPDQSSLGFMLNLPNSKYWVSIVGVAYSTFTAPYYFAAAQTAAYGLVIEQNDTKN